MLSNPEIPDNVKKILTDLRLKIYIYKNGLWNMYKKNYEIKNN